MKAGAFGLKYPAEVEINQSDPVNRIV